jgi:predicted amidohydrolase YtcJ
MTEKETEKEITIYKNCQILTMDPSDTIADSMAIFDGKIFSIGNNDKITSDMLEFIDDRNKNLKENNTQNPIKIIDLNGNCVVPGFIDVHMHPGILVYFRTQLDLSKVHSYTELETVIKKYSQTRKENEWIMGFDLMEDLFTDPSERRFPDRRILDKFCQDKPVVILRHDGHICTCNTIAMKIAFEKAGMCLSNVKLPDGILGEVRLDKSGDPSGIFTENATSMVLTSVPIPSMDRLKEAAEDALNELAGYGLTTCGGIVQTGDIGPAGAMGSFEFSLIEMIFKDLNVKQDFVFYFIADSPKKFKRITKTIEKLSKEKDQFTVGGLKLFIDGSFGARSACMFEPYFDDNTKSGFLVNDPKKIVELAKEMYELGFQTICHAIGDKGCRVLVDAFADAISQIEKTQSISSNQEKIKTKPRFRIEHASQLTDEIIRDIAKYGIIIAAQPAFINSEYTWLERRMGPNRIKFTYPYRSILDAGIVLAGASDCPIEIANVIQALQACVTRKGFVPEQCISIKEALQMFTINAAYAINQEKIKGSLEKGKYADFVILDKNPFKVSINDIYKIKILKTFRRNNLIFNTGK